MSQKFSDFFFKFSLSALHITQYFKKDLYVLYQQFLCKRVYSFVNVHCCAVVRLMLLAVTTRNFDFSFVVVVMSGILFLV